MNVIEMGTFGSAVKHDPWTAEAACGEGDANDAPAAGDGGVAEERVRELDEVEARLQVGRHDPRVVLAGALHRRLQQECRACWRRRS